MRKHLEMVAPSVWPISSRLNCKAIDFLVSRWTHTVSSMISSGPVPRGGITTVSRELPWVEIKVMKEQRITSISFILKLNWKNDVFYYNQGMFLDSVKLITNEKWIIFMFIHTYFLTELTESGICGWCEEKLGAMLNFTTRLQPVSWQHMTTLCSNCKKVFINFVITKVLTSSMYFN